MRKNKSFLRQKSLRVLSDLFVFIFIISWVWACSPEVPKMIPRPTVINEKVDTDGSEEVFDPKIDILFVVDDSGSMQSHQNNLASNIDLFVTNFLKRQDIDYHIGVVSTSMEQSPGYSGGWVAPCCGQLVGWGGFPYVTRSTPNARSVLKRNLVLGTNGSWQEMMFAPVMAALSPPLVGGVNGGFYRQDAFLGMIFITDAEDQSPKVSAQDFWDFLLTLKGRKDRLAAFGVIVPVLDNRSCSRDDDSMRPMRLEQFLSLANWDPNQSNVFNLCDPAFGNNLTSIGDILVKAVGNIIFLSRPPILSTIKVQYGSQMIPADPKLGWSYDPARNALILGNDIVWTTQPPGTKVQVFYEAARYPELQP